MDLRERMAEKGDTIKNCLLVFAVLLGFAFFINRDVEIEGLFMDDLYLWSCFGEQSFTEYVFPIGGTRFRFLFYLASYLELMLIGSNIGLMVPFNIVINAMIAFSIYRMAYHFNKKHAESTAVGIAYLISRLAYYQIGQFYGLMESLGLWAAIGMFYCIFLYMNEGKTKAFFFANLWYFCASFIHERYMVLLPVLLLGLLFAGRPVRKHQRAQEEEGQAKRSRRKQEMERPGVSKWALLPVAPLVFGLILLIRFITIGTLSPAGTGGTDVADTFKLEEAIGHAWEQVGFVFGIGTGPDYLCGMTYEKSPDDIVRLIRISIVILAVMVVIFLIQMLRDRRRIVVHLKNITIFLVFIALCIGSSSVTIRVEMRWVYVAYAMALLFLSYMSAYIGRASLLIFAYVALLFPIEGFYRDTWENLYLWPPQMRYNSLAEETYGRYGDDIYNRQVYIIGNSYDMTEFSAETFLQVFDGEDEKPDNTIRFLDSAFEFKEIPDNAVILWEDVEHNAYQDITEYVRTERFHYAKGSYPDGWIDENARMVFMTGDEGTVHLSCYYPGEIDGNQIVEVTMNGKRLPDMVFENSVVIYDLPTSPNQMVNLEFSCNFHVEDAGEQRGKERLAMIVDMTVK